MVVLALFGCHDFISFHPNVQSIYSLSVLVYGWLCLWIWLCKSLMASTLGTEEFLRLYLYSTNGLRKLSWNLEKLSHDPEN